MSESLNIDCNQEIVFKLSSINSHAYQGSLRSDLNDRDTTSCIFFNSGFAEFETQILSQSYGNFYFLDGATF
ncbi:hypothetical protein P700755_002285 [Psychroflexus torquis ATCC 700755]|uniref:Uncharacterized protein n=1 Tax=Psychroflexus torquis (strain ATCC 700755 / CIP 106069 / ACAM 623) TaxID=313595 RepID=K4IIZ8_PSYTT|nr:hypothetical protein P700755_002285 [Psychroflexus torquis ATCC 700755]